MIAGRYIYQQQKRAGKTHQTAIRALAYKWAEFFGGVGKTIHLTARRNTWLL